MITLVFETVQLRIMRRDVYQAIADPVRREIIDLLSDKTPSVNELAHQFEISRPAISKHLKILNESGVITIHKSGRERTAKFRLRI
ncbi:metalloregulator ArsR/SmtB family transcription factor [Aquimarina sp. 2201CG1-2-11]|uniref:ArsR/SmtB family transcription factor n=1 Tax=Aquimarina discodermiae TaxID=3231043 RepID=UPI0034621113